MTEEVAAQHRRKQPLMRTVGKHANRSSTRLNNKMVRAAGSTGLTPLTKLNGEPGGENGGPRFLGDRPRERSSDSIPKVPSAGRLAGKGGALSGKINRKSKQGDGNGPRKAVIQLEHADSDNGTSNSYEDTDSDTEPHKHALVSTEHDSNSAMSLSEAAQTADEAPQTQSDAVRSAAPAPDLDGRLPLPQRPGLMRRTSSALSVGISNAAPTPPQLSTETVVSVTSAVDMADALNVQSTKSQFVEEGDFISRAVNRSHSATDLQGIVGRNLLRTQQKLLMRQHQSHSMQSTPLPENAEARRGYERAVKEYINSRQLQSPVQASLRRVAARGYARSTAVPAQPSAGGSTGEGADAQLKIASLSATTINEMVGLTVDDQETLQSFSSPAQHMSNYLLLNLWNEGWTDPEKIDVDAPAAGDDIQAQAQKVYQRISAPQWSRRRSSTVKLV